MADPTIPPTDSPPKPRAADVIAARDAEIASLRAELETTKKNHTGALEELLRRDVEQKRAKELAAARAAEREKAIANKEAPKLIGNINVYLQDMPEDIVARAQPLFEGRVPIDRATKFKIDGKLTPSRDWPIFKRLGSSPKVGEVFDVKEMPAEEIARYAKQGVIVAVA